MRFAFTLSMPNRNSWDNRWSGEDRNYVIVRSYRETKYNAALIEQLTTTTYYHYSFGDGWSAGVSVRAVDVAEARELRRCSDGFSGYDWMVDSIVAFGKIQPRTQYQATDAAPTRSE